MFPPRKDANGKTETAVQLGLDCKAASTSSCRCAVPCFPSLSQAVASDAASRDKL
jgi:hypothetical protein